MDEPVWKQAELAGDFYQQEPAEYQPATRPTEVRFLYDENTLYVGAMLYDDRPDRLITNELKREFSGMASDSFGLVLDTFHDRRNSYGFLTNPGGATRDTLGSDNGRRNDTNWDGVWTARTAVLENGWSLEFAIPFKTLRFPDRESQEWGLNIVRTSRFINERSTWSPVPRQFTHYNVAYAGVLNGIAGVQPGRNLQVKPFATGQVGKGLLGGTGWDRDGDGGIDLKWGITSSLLMDVTWRTDFSQVEADEQQINLTRFSLFFPEKRGFFLENPANFQIGLELQGRRDLLPFFSRRIGLAGGQPVPVVGGVRVTGQAGPQTVGILNMQTESFEGDPGDNFSAIVLRRSLSATTSLGGFYFGRQSKGLDSFNRVSGFDFRFTPRRTFEMEALAMRSATAGQSGDWAGRTSFRLDSSLHRARLGFLHVGDGFRHDLGYVRRRGIGTVFGSYSRMFRPADTSGLVRDHTITANFEATSDHHYSQLLTQIGSVTYDVQFSDGGALVGSVISTSEHLAAPFGIGGTLTVAPGDYRYEEATVRYASNVSAKLSGGVEVRAGEFWTGSQRAVEGSVRVRMNAHVAASATLGRSHIDLPEGAFTGDLVGLRLDWSFTPRMFLNAFVQYNGETDTWLSNVRYNLIHRPLSDIYVVWNETRLPDEVRRALLFKYTHLIAF